MVTLTWFESEKELQELTGLNHNELYDAGFDLDDWDFGFVTDKLLDKTAYNHMNFECDYFFLIKALSTNNISFEPKHTEYNGKHYYMSYHS